MSSLQLFKRFPTFLVRKHLKPCYGSGLDAKEKKSMAGLRLPETDTSPHSFGAEE